MFLAHRWGNRGMAGGRGGWACGNHFPKVRPDKGSCCYFHFLRQGNEGPERRFYVLKNISSEVAGVESEPESLVTRQWTKLPQDTAWRIIRPEAQQ